MVASRNGQSLKVQEGGGEEEEEDLKTKINGTEMVKWFKVELSFGLLSPSVSVSLCLYLCLCLPVCLSLSLSLSVSVSLSPPALTITCSDAHAKSNKTVCIDMHTSLFEDWRVHFPSDVTSQAFPVRRSILPFHRKLP